MSSALIRIIRMEAIWTERLCRLLDLMPGGDCGALFSQEKAWRKQPEIV